MRKYTSILGLAGLLLPGLLVSPLGADDEFLRGDANSDGTVSLADEVMIARFLFAGQWPSECLDSMDANDDGRLNITDQVHILQLLHDPRGFFAGEDGWNHLLPAPYPEAGVDSSADDLDCAVYVPVESQFSELESVELGQLEAAPGETVEIPIYLTNSVEIDGIQLVLEYDPDLITPREGVQALILGPYYDQFDEDDISFNPVTMVNNHPEEGIVTIALLGSLAYDGYEVQPGEDHLVGFLPVTVSSDAEPDTVIELAGTNGPDDSGVGPHKLRNEVTHHGDTRYISIIPRVEPALLRIVGDLSFFRGDSNRDGKVQISDAVFTLDHLFSSDSESPRLQCMDAADANDDGALNISDPITTLMFLFGSGAALPAPHPNEGRDPTPDSLSCGAITR